MAVRVAAMVVSLCVGLPLIGVGLFLAYGPRPGVVRTPFRRRFGLFFAFVGVGAVVSGLQRLPLGTPASLVLLGISAAVAVAMLVLLVRLYRDRTPS